MNILRKASLVSDNTLASQAVQGLETLAMLVRYSIGRDNGAICTAPREDSVPYLKITVPGSGMITISPGKLMTRDECSSSEPARGLPLPTFTFSQQSGQASSSQEISTSLDFQHDQGLIGASAMDVSIMDMDWTNMFSAGLDDDWAWLADVNAAGMV